MGVKRPLAIHPLLFAIYPILYLYATNVDLLSFSEILVPLAITLGMTIVLFLGFRLLFKDGTKAGILTSAILILFFSYGHAWKALRLAGVAIWDWAPDRHGYLLLLWGLLFLLAVLVVVKKGSSLRAVTTYLNVVGALLLVAPLVTVGIHIVNRARLVPLGATPGNQIQVELAEKLPDRYNARLERPGATPESQIQVEVPEKSPDIYYVILDSYGRTDFLREVCDYDNSEFIEHLTAKGLCVASKSRSNYGQSYLSLASSLNMEYLNYLSDELGVESTDRTTLYSMIVDNRVQRTLRGAGYRFLHFSSGWGPTDHNRLADINYRPAVLNDFRTMLLETTMLNPIVQPRAAAQKRARTQSTFEMIGKIAHIEEPTFVFAHLLVPHFPFVFDRDCSPRHHIQGTLGFRGPDDVEAYVDQLVCVNKMVEALADEILARSEVPPIIVLQADHGPSEEMGIFNAFYLPEDGRSYLYSSITPVNTFRLIFDFYFGTNLGLLEDKSYFSNYSHPYQFIQVEE